jgi:hypothetical protein
MSITLHDISVASYLQTLTAVEGFMERGRVHFAEQGVDMAEVVETRLFDDMAPFRFQVLSVIHHSLHAIEGIQAGVFGPPAPSEPLDYAALQSEITRTIATLKALDVEAVNTLAGKDVAFAFGELKLPFIAETFVLSFSLPNLHFHATTAYDILRTKGVPLGKRFYMGPLRLKV